MNMNMNINIAILMVLSAAQAWAQTQDPIYTSSVDANAPSVLPLEPPLTAPSESAASPQDEALVRRSPELPAELRSPGIMDSRTTFALGGVILGIVMLAWLARRFFPQTRLGGGSTMQVIARTYISSKQSMALVRVGHRVLVVGVTPDHLTTLATIDDPAELAAVMTRDGKGAMFDRKLQQEAAEFNTAAPAPNPKAAAPDYDQTRRSLRDLVKRVQAATTASPE
jgi:flagellar protein FliO/FliZ